MVYQDQEWIAKWKKAIPQIGDGMTYQEAAVKLRQLISTKLLTLTDIQDDPDRFFEAHRLVASNSCKYGPGFSIRFTVHYNLFAGTVVGLGTDEQIKQLVLLNDKKPRLGCFALTEAFAGVNSGLVVQTTADFKNGEFLINSPTPGAAKFWISQGLVADDAVVVANVKINGKSIGPQAFLVRLRDDNGRLVSGVEAVDMGKKTVGNDLDNARLIFKNFKAPLNSLLARYVKVEPDGNVSYPQGNLRTMDMIGQRLFSGRIAVAQAGLTFARSLFATANAFASTKKCWAPGGETTLIKVPQIKAIFEKADRDLSVLEKFIGLVEQDLCNYLRKRQVPPVALQDSIAVVKVKCVEGAINLCHALKQEVGSYALMAGTGFEQLDFLTCCKFAEGDSRILMQKMARDVLGRGPQTQLEKEAVEKLKIAMGKDIKAGISKRDAWDNNYLLVYGLAEAYMHGVLQKTLTGSSKL
ncbi:hypothetical protein HDV06_003509 [Boothiomyces sp. JEL0866]|nr:hypothetical protein HDV06_003478 [Boothiomyces sp. JEL0866]KAJ3325739.1 hypothetical protein HDV06_003509 [Boothiomyces sp. JEL0866]